MGRLSARVSVGGLGGIFLKCSLFALQYLNLDVDFSHYYRFDPNDLQKGVPASSALWHVSTSLWKGKKKVSERRLIGS